MDSPIKSQKAMELCLNLDFSLLLPMLGCYHQNFNTYVVLSQCVSGALLQMQQKTNTDQKNGAELLCTVLRLGLKNSSF